jgi:hypothetical protein
MIIRIQANGGSFRGAGLYYLHDKSADQSIEKHLKPKSDERVWFTDTRNCLSMDPGRALEEMWRTAEDQAYLKMQAGVKLGGRVCEDPTKTLSLSWHKDDKATPEHMVEAADALLKHMGWDAHQAVYVGHNDTEHRHIHIILNRVNPETGRTLDDFREQKRAQSWALQYERQQDQVRCEQRELNAAREAGRAEHRQHGAAQTNEPVHVNTRDVTPGHVPMAAPAPSHGRAANDHLPHNVIMLARPLEQAFAADEQHRKARDVGAHSVETVDQKEELKDRQRDEREAFFKDGAKLFKATRHAAYDEVRNEYKAEWRKFYKDSNAARKSAETASEYGVSRAHYFAKDGQWDKAREAFNDRDNVRDAVEKQLTACKADLKLRQTDDLRERQRDACDSLRQVRDVQYQELLQRQRDERAAFRAGETLDAAGILRDRPGYGITSPPPENAANENRSVEASASRQTDQGTAPPVAVPVVPEARLQQQAPKAHQVAEQVEQSAAIAQSIDRANGKEMTLIELPHVDSPEQTTIAPVRGASDLMAGGIGGAASYLADQLGELFAPTPPEVREAAAKEAAKSKAQREIDTPQPDKPASDYDRMIDAAIRIAETDQHYWKDRDRGKGWERDQ